ncbi:hypothetical protein NDU88_009033 [Pleurodeles waltl]|uniref:Uncharacterized protein n=1 Tax=Pleurodeles waltl TaxID=8319 RepID=A0AAV7PW53_PLEWA|nr:hypothetical protein NDU88_009033 [Pleurodeles waltl]
MEHTSPARLSESTFNKQAESLRCSPINSFLKCRKRQTHGALQRNGSWHVKSPLRRYTELLFGQLDVERVPKHPEDHAQRDDDSARVDVEVPGAETGEYSHKQQHQPGYVKQERDQKDDIAAPHNFGQFGEPHHWVQSLVAA